MEYSEKRRAVKMNAKADTPAIYLGKYMAENCGIKIGDTIMLSISEKGALLVETEEHYNKRLGICK